MNNQDRFKRALEQGGRVIAPFGFKVEEKESGEFYLVPATPDELAHALLAKQGEARSLEAIKQDLIAAYGDRPWCDVTVEGKEFKCIPKNNCKSCGIVWEGGTDPAIVTCHC